MNLIYLPAWSSRVLAALALGLIVLALVRWWRERRLHGLLVLRLLVLAVLLWVMLNPQALLPREHAAKPRLIVLLDGSASMATRDEGGNSRYAAAAGVLNEAATLANLNHDFDLEIRRFDAETQPVEPGELTRRAPSGDASDIARAVMGAVSELGDSPSQAGVLVISDGRATTPNTLDAAELALARSVPLWTWTTGGIVPRRDLWIETASSETLAFKGAEVELSASLKEVGYPNRSFKVEILKNDKIIETKEVLPNTNGTARVTISVKAPEAGEERYVFRVPPEPDEADAVNNERAVFLRSVGEKVRVLVVEGQPHWDTKFLVQSLTHDPHVDMTAVYRLNASRHVAVVFASGEQTRVEKDLFPRTADEMNRYDVIVLGREAETFFDASTDGLLTDYVAKRGGSLVFARGKAYGGRFQPLAKLEPVAWGNGVKPGVRLRPTEAARDNPIFDLGSAGTVDEMLDRLPALDQASVTLGEKPLAVVLASANNTDGPVVLAYQRYGQGKAVSLNAGGLWRWSFREADQQESSIAYQRFWISLLQWLLSGSQFLPGADVSLSSSRRYYSSDQPMQFLISTRNLDRSRYQPTLTVSGNGKTLDVEPRARGESFTAEAGPFAPGTYRVTLHNNIGSPREVSENIEIVSASVENRELSADPETMRKLAEISGGAVVTGRDVSHLSQVVKRWEASRQLSHRQRPVWDRWWLLGSLVALLGLEWWWRRQEGLL